MSIPPTAEKSQTQKAFYALSQYRDTIAHIMLDNDHLNRTYQVLLWLTTTTLATATLTAGVTFFQTGFSPDTILTAAIAGVLLVLLPWEASVTSASVGGVALGVHVTGLIPPIPVPTLYGFVVIGCVGSAVVGLYLTRHAINIGAQLWDQLLELETTIAPEEPGDDLVEDPADDPDMQSSSNQ